VGSIELKSVRKRFNSFEALHAIDLKIEDRERVVFVGPSGCGKSTLLRLICGIEDVTDGSILIDGVDVTAVGSAKRGVAMVFQNYALYPHMTAEQNMGFSLRVAGVAKEERKRIVKGVAAILQLEHLLHRYPKELSGGQRQRVAIGRAMVRRPKAFLFDEPLSNLDAALRVDMRLEIIRLHEQLQTTMIYVTHDQAEAMTLADRIVVLNGGHIEQVDTPRNIYHRPANVFVARFIGSPKINLIDLGKLSAAGLDDLVALAMRRFGPQVQSVGVRPEMLQFSEGSSLSRRCITVEYFGSETIAYFEGFDENPLAAKASGESPFEPGQAYPLTLDPTGLVGFDAKGKALPFAA
jgi:multiple sugar transport system ATP-binding protein